MENDLQKKIKRRKIRNRLIVGIIIIVIAVLVALYLINEKKGKELVFDTVTVSRGKLTSTVSSTGTLSPVSTVDVGSQVSGTIEAVHVDFNERVNKGQILVHLDPSIYRSKLDIAEAQLRSAHSDMDSARAELDKANIAISKAQADVFSAQARVDGDRANLIRAESQLTSSQTDVKKAEAQMNNDLAEYNRAQELFRRDLVSASEKEKAYTLYLVSQAGYESALAGVKVAGANINAARSTLNASIANLTSARTTEDTARANARSAQARIASAQASIQQAQGRVDEAVVNINYCTIRSPIDGVVINRKIEPGQTVAASFQTPVLLQLAENLRRMEVKAAVDEADIGKVRTGQKVSFTVDAYPDDQFEGSIQQVRSAPNTDTQDNVVTYDVIILTDNDDLKLKPGMTANIDITVDEKDDILLVSNSAMRFRPNRFPNFPYPEEEKDQKPGDKDEDKSGTAEKTGEKNQAGPRGQGNRGNKGARGEKGGRPGGNNRVSIWVLSDEKPRQVEIVLGITDNENTEVVSGDLKEGMEVIVDAMTRKEKKAKDKTANATAGSGSRRRGHVRF